MPFFAGQDTGNIEHKPIKRRNSALSDSALRSMIYEELRPKMSTEDAMQITRRILDIVRPKT